MIKCNMVSRWDPGIQKRTLGKAREIRTKYGLSLTIYQYWFITSDKCTKMIKDINRLRFIWKHSVLSLQ